MLAKLNFVTTVLNNFYLLRQIDMYDVRYPRKIWQ
jgi:hypothetical protein